MPPQAVSGLPKIREEGEARPDAAMLPSASHDRVVVPAVGQPHGTVSFSGHRRRTGKVGVDPVRTGSTIHLEESILSVQTTLKLGLAALAISGIALAGGAAASSAAEPSPAESKTSSLIPASGTVTAEGIDCIDYREDRSAWEARCQIDHGRARSITYCTDGKVIYGGWAYASSRHWDFYGSCRLGRFDYSRYQYQP